MTDHRTVPVEPTDEMIAAGASVAQSGEAHHVSWGQQATETYRAMLAAAPALSASPAPAPGDLVERVDATRRIDLDEEGELDDLAIDGSLVKMVRLERLSGNSFWMRLYMHDGNDLVLSLHTNKALVRATIEEGKPLPAAPEVGG